VIIKAVNDDTVRQASRVPGKSQWEGFSTRLVSAVVFGGAIIALVYLGGLAFSAAVTVFGLLMIFEWDKLCGGSGFDALGLGHMAAIGMITCLAAVGMFDFALATVFVSAAVFGVWALIQKRSVPWPALGIIYVAVPCLSVVWLRADEPHGMLIVIWAFAIVWSTDTGAYIFGKSIGGPRLAPSISPKKTWAGLVGGTICGTIAGTGAAYASGFASLGALAAISCALTFAAHGGDLVESAVKRHFGVKDSGTLIPGHGGILDRVDGLIFVWPTMVVAQALHGGSLLPWVPR
jgi:phosphatidate cytidylyltransferase